MNERRLITGGWGLVGSEIPNTYGRKPHRKTLDLMEYGSLYDYANDYRIDEIVHLAAKVGGVAGNENNMLSFFSDNLTINANIIRLCAERNIKKATFMLSTCVFPHKVEYPVDETALHQGEPHPTNYGYAYAKRMLEVGARALRDDNTTQVRCVIPCNIYGKRDNYDIVSGHVIPSLIHKCYKAARQGLPFQVWGSGECEREFVYAPDIARAVTMIHDDTREIPNLMIVSPSVSHKIKDIALMIADCMEFHGRILFDTSRPEGILRKPTKNDLFKKAYPNFRFTDIYTGIEETCDFVKENYDSIRK
jgi:GDP-L-fucose synthase